MDSITLSLLLLLLSASSLLLTAVSGGGFNINYGQIADNLPDPAAVVPLIKSMRVARLRLYDADARVLKAFAGTGIELSVSLGNEFLPQMRDPASALQWVKSNVQCYPNTKITSIAVGNEFLTNSNTTDPGVLISAMDNVHAALVTLGLDKRVGVSTAHNFGIVEVSYPPSAGAFRPDLTKALKCVLEFHRRVGSPFLINAYPYFAYKANPNVSLNFVLFKGEGGFLDTGTGLYYDNMFHAQIDAAQSAMERLMFKDVCLQVAETGWPSKGDPNEAGATPEYAKTYNGNLIKLINSKKGTPMRPNLDLTVYIFALFNENKKLGPTSERNFGLFKPDGTPVYDLGFNVTGLGTSGSGSGSVSGPPSIWSPVVGPPPDGYMSITADDAERLPLGRALLLSLSCLATLALQL